MKTVLMGYGKWVATVLASVVVFVASTFFLSHSSRPALVVVEATKAASVSSRTLPSYLAPIAKIPAGTISAIQPLPALPEATPINYVQQDEQPLPIPEEPTTKWRVAASSLNVREAPSSKSARVASVSEGDLIDLLERSGGWARVAVAGGTEGWVFSKYLRKDETVASID
jgi:uncharacterized protein YgiM (DUF1202 family)